MSKFVIANHFAGVGKMVVEGFGAYRPLNTPAPYGQTRCKHLPVRSTSAPASEGLPVGGWSVQLLGCHIESAGVVYVA